MTFTQTLKYAVGGLLREWGFFPPVKKRGFDAGHVSRTNRDFSGDVSTVEMDWLTAFLTVRQRARDLVKNNDYAKKALLLFRVNVVGPTGFKFQSNVKELTKDANGNWAMVSDEVANNKIETAVKDWAKKNNCSVNGMSTLRGTEDLAAQYWFRDGEAILRIVKNPNAKYVAQLQLIEPEALDESFNAILANGNVVKMGVEVDEWRRPVNYYFRKRTPQSELFGALATNRVYDVVPAEEILHLFDREFVNQTRGISLLVQSMLRLRMLTGYEMAALFNARASANKQLLLKNRDTDTGAGMDSGMADAQDQNGNAIMTLEPGSVLDVGDKDPVEMRPEYPTAQHEMFVKTTMHGVSAGVGMAYSSVTNDLGDTSYSSGRIGLLDERDQWKLRQQIFIEVMLDPLFAAWLPYAILSGQVALPMSKLDKFTQPSWIGRRWPWVDPLKDLAAMALAREIKIETLTQQLAEKGDDLLETLQEFKDEEDEAQKRGMTTVVKAKETGSVASAQGNAADQGSEEGSATKTTTTEGKANRFYEMALRLLAEGEPANGNGKGH